jgi:Transglutaminase-like superfamily
MMKLYIGAFRQLLRFQYYILLGDFALLYRKVQNCTCSPGTPSPELTERVCAVMDVACICYPKHVLCLQRSAATACLLRKYSVPARMVLGVQKLPFKAHAWVEVEGRVVNDKPYTRELYSTLDYC